MGSLKITAAALLGVLAIAGSYFLPEETSRTAAVSHFAPSVAVEAVENIAANGAETPAGRGAEVPVPLLRTVRERQAFYDGAASQPAAAVFDRWLEGSRTPAGATTQMLLLRALTNTLARNGDDDQALCAALTRTIADDTLDPGARAALARALGESSTPIGTAALLAAVMSPLSEDARGSVLDGVRSIGAEAPADETSRVSIGTLIEEAWHGTADPRLRSALGFALAQTGTASSVQALVEGVAALLPRRLDGDSTVESASAPLLDALTHIRHPDAIPVLAAGLVTHDIDDAVLHISAAGLAHMSQPRASSRLIEWSLDAPAEAALAVREWFEKATRDSVSQELIASFIANEPFRSEEVRNAIGSVLKAARPVVEDAKK